MKALCIIIYIIRYEAVRGEYYARNYANSHVISPGCDDGL